MFEYAFKELLVIKTLAPSVTITDKQLVEFKDITTSTFTLSAGKSIEFTLSLESRYFPSYFEYKRDAATVESIIISYKPNKDSDWEVIDSNMVSDKATLVTQTDKPVMYKIKHEVVTGESVVYGVDLYSSDKIKVLSGSSLMVDYVEQTDNPLTVSSVFLVNEQNEPSTFFTFCEKGVSASDNSGTVPMSDRFNYKTVPSSFSWASGSFSNTNVTGSDTLVLTDTLLAGSYYSPVFDLSSLSAIRTVMDYIGSNPTDTSKSVVCVLSVRHSNNPPSGPWVDGQLSNDAEWSITTGTLPFTEVQDKTIINVVKDSYIQVKVDLYPGSTNPEVSFLGSESSVDVTVPANSQGTLYTRYTGSDKQTSLTIFKYGED